MLCPSALVLYEIQIRLDPGCHLPPVALNPTQSPTSEFYQQASYLLFALTHWPTMKCIVIWYDILRKLKCMNASYSGHTYKCRPPPPSPNTHTPFLYTIHNTLTSTHGIQNAQDSEALCACGGVWQSGLRGLNVCTHSHEHALPMNEDGAAQSFPCVSAEWEDDAVCHWLTHWLTAAKTCSHKASGDFPIDRSESV